MEIRRGRMPVQFWLAWALLLATLGAAGSGAVGQVKAPVAVKPAQAGGLATTTVSDVIYRADGTPAQGTVLISWPSFTIATGASVPAGTTSVTLAADGTLSVNLVANAGAIPMGSYYTVVYHLDDGSVTREYWAIPVSANAVSLAAIRSTVLPASVAMQTVSKNYVDTAIAAAVLGHPLDASTPYVVKTGDTMSGPLVLPGDPVTALQASDKNYVDTQVSAVAAGIGQKVATNPQATQQVAQPAGTDLEVNNLNGALYASQYVTGPGSANAGNNGIANAAASADCTGGCEIVAEHSYAGSEQPAAATWNNGTVTEDHRNGQRIATFLNPKAPSGINIASEIDLTSTESAVQTKARTGAEQIFHVGQQINTSAPTGGSDEYPRNVQGSIPYFKTTYVAQSMFTTNNTPGQHLQALQEQRCYSVGDCLMGSKVLLASGGLRDDADEGVHPYDFTVLEDPAVFEGTCATGCATGATVIGVTTTASPGTQGDGRYLIDTNPAKTLQAGSLIGGQVSGRQPQAVFSGTNFPVSVFLETTQTIPSQPTDVSPGTVTVAIATSAVPAGFATNTAALPATTGVACVADATNSQVRFETAAYTVVDGSHVRLTLQRPHQPGATISVGGLCGYGLEQKVDTSAGIRQVFPVVGSPSATTLLYAGGQTAIVGISGLNSGFANVSLVVSAIARSGNVVTVTTNGNFGRDVNGLTLSVQGVTDSSYNGSYVVTTTGPNTLTYTSSGPDSSSAGGTLTYLTGSYALYPMAEVISVYNQATKAIDGQMTLAANTVAWSAGDTVEQPHYFQNFIYPDFEYVKQVMPRPSTRRAAGLNYDGNNGPGLVGWDIANSAAASSYYGNGGTMQTPDIAMEVDGAWTNTLQMQAGEQTFAHVLCNSHGCNKWNSAYNLFQLDTGVGSDQINFAPQSSNLNFTLRGTGYSFTPQAFTAGTINVTTLNAGSVHGLFTGSVAASSLPVFAASGAAHAVGAVPDPGPTAGTTRYLREDGTWQAVVASGGGGVAMPEKANLLSAYLMNEGSGTTLLDTSGQGNNATLSGPSWEGAQDITFNSTVFAGSNSGMNVLLPQALNAAQTFMFLTYFPVQGLQTAPQAPGFGSRSGYLSILGGTTQKHLNLLSSLSERTFGYKFHAFNTDDTRSSQLMPPGWHVFVLSCGSNGVPAREYFDGVEVGGYEAQGSNTCPVQPSGNYVLGGSPAYSGQSFVGKFAGMWTWSTALTPVEAANASANAFALLDAKGIPRTFNAKVQVAPQILAVGDSRTIGYGLPAGADWPDQMQLTDPNYVRTNTGVASSQTADMCNEFELAEASRAGRGSGQVITTIFAGMSDMQNGATDPVRIAANLRCVVAKAKVLGRVVLATEISGAGGNTDTTKDALNVILRAQAFGWGVDNLADLATDPHIGADGAANNTACFPDNLHPGTACEPYITAIMQNSVNELLGASETSRHQSAAAAVQEVAGDRYLDLTGSGAQTVTLPDCTGYSMTRTVLNLGSAAATVQAVSGQTLVGTGTIATGTRGVFLPIPGAAATGGCSWERTQ